MKTYIKRFVAFLLITAILSILCGCEGIFDTEKHVLKGVKVNGKSLKKYTLVVPDIEEYDLPITTAKRFFKKYCGVKINVTDDASAVSGNKIIIGGTKADGTEYADFEAEIYTKDGDIHLGSKTALTSQRALYALFHQYFNDVNKLAVEIPDNSDSLYYTDEPDWDGANPDILTIQDKIVRGCYKLEEILQYDRSQKKYFTYQGPKGYMGTIAESRSESAPKEKQRTTNCVIVGNWVMKDAGFYSSGIYNHTYDGTTGYTFSKEAKPFFEENFEVIDLRGKDRRIADLQEEGVVWPGDIIGFTNHNQMIMPNGNAFDAGRSGSNMNVPETGGKFERWLGPNPYPSATVGFIIRSKDATKY